MPPAFRNHLVPTACGTPAPTAASSLAMPAAIAAQNRRRSSRPATGGRPGDDNGARPDRSERRFRMFIATSFVKVLRRPLEFAHYSAIRIPLPLSLRLLSTGDNLPSLLRIQDSRSKWRRRGCLHTRSEMILSSHDAVPFLHIG